MLPAVRHSGSRQARCSQRLMRALPIRCPLQPCSLLLCRSGHQQSHDFACIFKYKSLTNCPAQGVHVRVEAVSSVPCRVPDEYQPDLEANPVVQVKRKVSCALTLFCLSTLASILIAQQRMYGQLSSYRSCLMSYLKSDFIVMVRLDACKTALSARTVSLCACVQGGEVRYCQKCCKPKPPRTHHCKVCKRCVLR